MPDIKYIQLISSKEPLSPDLQSSIRKAKPSHHAFPQPSPILTDETAQRLTVWPSGEVYFAGLVRIDMRSSAPVTKIHREKRIDIGRWKAEFLIDPS